MKEIRLTQGKIALVDDDIYEKLNSYKWCTHKCGTKIYAARKVRINGKCISFRMHRFIMNPSKGMQVDHLDENGLNNQRSNLRICTASQNRMNRGKQIDNTSGYKGVSWSKGKNIWQSLIGVERKQIHLGFYNNKEKAYRVYCEAAKKYHGEFAYI